MDPAPKVIAELLAAAGALQREQQALGPERGAWLLGQLAGPDEPELARWSAELPAAAPVELLLELARRLRSLLPPALAQLAVDPSALVQLDAPQATALTRPLVAVARAGSSAVDREALARVLTSLGRRPATDEREARLVRRALRAMLLADEEPRASGAALAGLSLACDDLSADAALLARVDLLLLGDALDAPARRALAEHLCQRPAAFARLVADGCRGSTFDRWRAAELLGCVAALERPSAVRSDPVRGCLALLRDPAVRVWRAAAAALGRLAARLERAHHALEAFTAREAELRLRRRAAAAVGHWYRSAPDDARAALERGLDKSADPWLVGSFAFSLPGLAASDGGACDALARRLLARRGPAVPLNLALVLRDLRLRGDTSLDQLVPDVREAVEKRWQPRDPGAAALREMARDALAAVEGGEDALAFGSRVLALVPVALSGGEQEGAWERALEQGWQQARRAQQPDLAGIAARGRALFDARDLATALFEDDLLDALLRAAHYGQPRVVGRLRAEYESLRREVAAQIERRAGELEACDRGWRRETLRAVAQVKTGRGCQREGSAEGAEVSRPTTADMSLVVDLATRTSGRERSELIATLAHLIESGGPSLQRALTALALQRPDPQILTELATISDEGTHAPLRALAAAAAVDVDDERGVQTAALLRSVAEIEPRGSLGQAAVAAATAIEYIGALETAEGLATPVGALGGRSAARALAESWAVVGEVAQPAVDGARESWQECAASVDALAPRLLEESQREARVSLARELATCVDALLVQLEQLAPGPLARGLARAFDGWRAALAAEIAAAEPSPIPPTKASMPPGAFEPTQLAQLEQRIEPGARLGEFEIVERLSTGGMGEVFRARQLSLDRLVALKVLRHEICDSDEVLQRFRREARTMARWTHDNLLRVITYDEGPPVAYLVTELVQGSSLAGSLGDLSPRRALEIGEQVARALAHAHADGVVHRDVSPDNVLVREDGQVLLMDFGIALVLEESRLTQQSWYGKPDYMSPEQFYPKDDKIGAPTDVYALGVMLYQLLSGELPFESRSVPQLLADKATERFVPLRRRLPDVPVAVDRLVAEMMRAVAARRPTAAEVAETLAEVLRQL